MKLAADKDWGCAISLPRRSASCPKGPGRLRSPSSSKRTATTLSRGCGVEWARRQRSRGARAHAAGTAETPQRAAADHDARGDDRGRCARMPRFKRCSIESPTARSRCGSVLRSCSARRCRCSVLTLQVVCRAGAAARVRPRADAPCATCPGGRAGPGGAPAFSREGRGEGIPAEGTAAGGRGRGRGATARTLKLSREPALGALARDTGELGKRAAGVLARVEWPGKPGARGAGYASHRRGTAAIQRRTRHLPATCVLPAISLTDAAARSSRPRFWDRSSRSVRPRFPSES